MKHGCLLARASFDGGLRGALWSPRPTSGTTMWGMPVSSPRTGCVVGTELRHSDIFTLNDTAAQVLPNDCGASAYHVGLAPRTPAPPGELDPEELLPGPEASVWRNDVR